VNLFPSSADLFNIFTLTLVWGRTRDSWNSTIVP